MGSTHPYYRRYKPSPQNEKEFSSDVIDLSSAHLVPYDLSPPPAQVNNSVELYISPAVSNSINDVNAHLSLLKDRIKEANRLFDKRAAAAIKRAAEGINLNDFKSIMEEQNSVDAYNEFAKTYGEPLIDESVEIHVPTVQSLVAIAYPDFFPGANDDSYRRIVSEAILAANPGWCGTFSAGADGTFSLNHTDGNYDMAQMHLLQIAYGYYDELSEVAQEHLITQLLAYGRIKRPNRPDIFTCGGVPNDWRRAGFISPLGAHKDIGETENHILMIHTARYLTNQLIYQRDKHPSHDNRRNGGDDYPSCMDLMLYLLRNILRDDFSEYNAKPYQHETRTALLNLCSYAYDHEVRLAARMVLDYISAHIAVSSNDLRRMVPFRRRNESDHNRNAQLPGRYMDVHLLDWSRGADPMMLHFVMQTGQTRAFETTDPSDINENKKPWSITNSDGGNAVVEVLSEYRIPPSIHDLFVTDAHRRFFQKLHRIPLDDVEVTGRNCNNYEIYASSPSYLITAGGSPAPFAIDPEFAGFVMGDQAQQVGVAVTTSFMPTGQSAGPNTQHRAADLIQFSHFSDNPNLNPAEAENYGVAPDFACGYCVYLPSWFISSDTMGNFTFLNKRLESDFPGFFLALFRDGDFVVLEAFDTWLHPDLTYDQFKNGVLEQNKNLINPGNYAETEYTTQNGNRIRFKVWNEKDENGETAICGASIVSVDYCGSKNFLHDSFGDAGNSAITEKFLHGTVMNNPADGVIEITNHSLGTKITLDMSDQQHPKRISETGEVEQAGYNSEVWVDFAWNGPTEGDFFHPFNSIEAATAAVADGGTIKIAPGSKIEKLISSKDKRIRITAPLGGVSIGL